MIKTLQPCKELCCTVLHLDQYEILEYLIAYTSIHPKNVAKAPQEIQQGTKIMCTNMTTLSWKRLPEFSAKLRQASHHWLSAFRSTVCKHSWCVELSLHAKLRPVATSPDPDCVILWFDAQQLERLSHMLKTFRQAVAYMIVHNLENI